MRYSCGVIHCLPWISHSHWSLACSPPPSLSEQIFDVFSVKQLRVIANHSGILDPTSRWGANCQISSCHGPAGGAPAAGIGGGGGAAERIPRDTPPNLARRGEIATKTQKLTPISNCEPLPNHMLPLARFGAPLAYVAAAWCGPITTMLAREVGAPNNTARNPKVQHAYVGGC
jgi:hypothetical protein